MKKLMTLLMLAFVFTSPLISDDLQMPDFQDQINRMRQKNDQATADWKAMWAQTRKKCIDSGGQAASNYNDWIKENGCKCNGSSTGTGNATCAGSSGTAEKSSDSNSQLIQHSTDALVYGVSHGSAEALGWGIAGLALSSATSQPAQPSAAELAQQAEQRQRLNEAQLLYNSGNYCLRQKNYSCAINEFEKALAKNPGDQNIRNSLAQAKRRLKFEEAKQESLADLKGAEAQGVLEQEGEFKIKGEDERNGNPFGLKEDDDLKDSVAETRAKPRTKKGGFGSKEADPDLEARGPVGHNTDNSGMGQLRSAAEGSKGQRRKSDEGASVSSQSAFDSVGPQGGALPVVQAPKASAIDKFEIPKGHEDDAKLLAYQKEIKDASLAEKEFSKKLAEIDARSKGPGVDKAALEIEKIRLNDQATMNQSKKKAAEINFTERKRSFKVAPLNPETAVAESEP